MLGRKIPVPVVPHVPDDAPPPTCPFSVTDELLAHTATSLPAFEVPGGSIVIVAWSDTALQLPLLVDVNVSITLPAVTSPALHWYVALSVVLFGTNVPVPVVVQIPVLVGPEILPLNPTFRLLTHVTWSLPAFTDGAARIVMVILSVTGKQFPMPVDVIVSVTVPAEISAAVGVYTAFIAVVDGAYVPFPPDHIAPPATVKVPLSVTVGLLAHDVWLAPAFTVGAGVYTM